MQRALRPGRFAIALLMAGLFLSAHSARPASSEKPGDLKGLSPKVFELAVKAAKNAHAAGYGTKKNLITVIDYSLPSTKKRLWVIGLDSSEVLFHELVAHGRGTGENRAKKFSNKPQSLMSSLGLYETSGTYMGKHGYSLKLVGLEKGFNDNALARDIVVHGAWYVSEDFARQHGRLGRSWGCPAVSEDAAKKLIDAIKGGSLLFVYYPDKTWLSQSVFLK